MKRLRQIDEKLRVVIRDGDEAGGVAEFARLVATGANVNGRDSDGDPFLHLAAMYQHPEMVAALIAAGATVSATNARGLTPLFAAIANNSSEAVCALIEAGADVNAQNQDGDTPLHYAASPWLRHICETLLRAGADPKVAREDGTTPLHLAAEAGGESTVQLLIDAGADSNALDSNLEGPAMRAVRYGHDRVLELLKQAGAQLHVQNYECESLLMTALKAGQVEAAIKLLDDGHSARSLNVYGVTPLHYAARECDGVVVKRLVDAGLAVDATSTVPKGATALHFAAEAGNVSACRALVDAGASPSQQLSVADKDYLTPFQSAVKKRCLEVVRYFVTECGEDLAQRTAAGRTMVQLAGSVDAQFKEGMRALKTELSVRAATDTSPPALAMGPQRRAEMVAL